MPPPGYYVRVYVLPLTCFPFFLCFQKTLCWKLRGSTTFRKSTGEQALERCERTALPRGGKAGKLCQRLGKGGLILVTRCDSALVRVWVGVPRHCSWDRAAGAGCPHTPWGAHLAVSNPEQVGRDGEHSYLGSGRWIADPSAARRQSVRPCSAAWGGRTPPGQKPGRASFVGVCL